MGDRGKSETSRRAVLKGSALGAGALFGAAGLTATARAATGAAPRRPGEPVGDQYFLKLDGITGDVTREGSRGVHQARRLQRRVRRVRRPTAPPGKAKEAQVHFDAPSQHRLASADAERRERQARSRAAPSSSPTPTTTSSSRWISSTSSSAPTRSSPSTRRSPDDQASLSFGKIKFAFYHAERRRLPGHAGHDAVGLPLEEDLTVTPDHARTRRAGPDCGTRPSARSARRPRRPSRRCPTRCAARD